MTSKPQSFEQAIVDGFRLLRVKFRFSWGFSVRLPGTSASEPTLKLPPPTTLIGALARGLAYVLDLPEVYVERGEMVSTAEKVSGFTRSVHLSLLTEEGKAPFWSIMSDITRMQALQYLQPKYWRLEHMDTWFGVHSVGKVYIPSVLSEGIYVIDGSEAERALGGDWRSVLIKSALSMTAVGVKESIVSVEDARLTPMRHIKTEGYVSSRFYFPSKAVSPSDLVFLRRELMEDEYWDHRDRKTRVLDPRKTMTADRIPYVIPIGKGIPKPLSEDNLPRLRFRLSGKGVALTDIDPVEEALKRGDVVLTLRRWLT
ncbi:type I-A CRISPR-associated protein Cas5 [Candidatus Bathyarchaeota archaeon]|nr:MAG: type I-A CRISPR-associated protein Cas5 [Candidatus Bathyarchaeota archaeon]